MATTKKTTAKKATKKTEKASSVYDYLRFGESYTSLVLGIIVVIIGTVLLLSLVRTRNVTRTRSNESQITQNAAKTSVSEKEMATSSATETPKQAVAISPSPTKPTAIPTKKPTATPTPATTKPTATAVPAKKVEAPTAKPTDKPVARTTELKQGGTYVVAAGDNLWTIAEKAYDSGYNWVDVARANKLSNPDDVKVGQKLVLPKAEQKNATSEPEWTTKATSTQTASQAEKIATGTYTIKEGDNLWSIAVRAYGDGYKWVKLKEVNKLANPDVIFAGAKLTIPKK